MVHLSRVYTARAFKKEDHSIFLSPSLEEATQGQGYAFFHVEPCVVVGPCNSELMKNSSRNIHQHFCCTLAFFPWLFHEVIVVVLFQTLFFSSSFPLCALLLNSHQQRKKVPRDSKAKKRKGEKDIQQKKRAKKEKATFGFCSLDRTGKFDTTCSFVPLFFTCVL